MTEHLAFIVHTCEKNGYSVVIIITHRTPMLISYEFFLSFEDRTLSATLQIQTIDEWWVFR